MRKMSKGQRCWEEKGEVDQLGLMESGGEKVAGSFSADSGGSDSPSISNPEQDFVMPMRLDREDQAIQLPWHGYCRPTGRSIRGISNTSTSAIYHGTRADRHAA